MTASSQKDTEANEPSDSQITSPDKKAPEYSTLQKDNYIDPLPPMTSSLKDIDPESISIPNSEGMAVLFGRCRYMVLILANVCLTFAMSNSLAYNFTVICMDDVIVEANRTGSWHWLMSSTHANLLFSANAIGCLVGTLPLTFLVGKFGIGKTITLYGILSTFATLLFPFTVWAGYPFVFIAKVLQGVATCLSYPACGLISSQWATKKGTGAYIAILSCHIQFCSVFTMPVAGELCESSYGWRSLYYLQGILSLASFALFYWFYRDQPAEQKMCGAMELERIQRGKEKLSSTRAVPYRAICTDPCVIGVWLSIFGGTLGFQTFLLYGPIYINKALNYDIKATGFATALPFILSAALKFALGPISDKAEFISQRARIVLFAAVSQGMMTICIVIMAKASTAVVAQSAYTMAIVFSGVNAVGSMKCANLVAQQYVYFLLSVSAFFMCIIGLLMPVAVDIIVVNQTPEEWSRLFLGVSLIVVLASVPFVFVARDQPAEWTTDKDNDIMMIIRLTTFAILFTAITKTVINTIDRHKHQQENQPASINCSSNMCQIVEGLGCYAYQEHKELKNAINIQNIEQTEHLWKSIWHISQSKPNLDHRIREAWQHGYTGRGVVISIVDEGLDWKHPDILPNYDQRASYDYSDMDVDPMPSSYFNDHGTNCAGVVAASITSNCTVGVTFNARVGGIRLITDAVPTDTVIATALNHNMDYVDIYSSSWSPRSNLVVGPSLVLQPLKRGAEEGRNGKGTIFVFSAGNAEDYAESNSGNGYLNSIYTIGITSATENGDSPYYGMRGTNILGTTFSNGWQVRGITTTSSKDTCINNFGGTSASAPIASGIIALTLEANPNLGWRDVQHIIVRTANSEGLRDYHWKKNGVGRPVSDTFGYGLLDAAAMVILAKVWKPVPQQKRQITHFLTPRTIFGGDTFELDIHITKSQIVYLEHVQLSFTLKSENRGKIEVYLTSPMGTKSTMLPKRPKDTSSEGFNDWHFMTTHLWGEEAKGIWQLEVSNGYWTPTELVRFSLKMYGTTEKPQL